MTNRCQDEQLIFAKHIVGLVFVLLTAACAGLQGTQPSTPPQTGAMQGNPVAAVPPATLSTDQAAAGAEAPPQAAELPPAVTRPTVQAATKAESPMAKTPTKLPASPLPAEQVRKKESLAQVPATQESPAKQEAPAKQQTSAPLDLKSLQTRLKETKAIGLFTKIALKNQVTDLLDQFRAFHQGRLKTTLAELRRPYDMLVLKVLALLQDSDPPLAGEIVASREAIWGILSDPAKFSTNLAAGGMS